MENEMSNRNNLISKLNVLLSDQLETPVGLLNEGESHINSYRVYVGGFRTNVVVGYEEIMYWDEHKQAELVNTLKGVSSPKHVPLIKSKVREDLANKWLGTGILDGLKPIKDESKIVDFLTANSLQTVTDGDIMPEESIVWNYSIIRWCIDDGESMPHGVIIEIDNGDRQYLTTEEFTTFLNNRENLNEE